MSEVDLTKSPIYLTVPGIDNSGPGHWQTIWEQDLADCHRVELGMWNKPNRNSWVNNLNLAIKQAARPVVLIAHSLGCHAVAWWANMERPAYGNPVIGAMLVAPADIEYQTVDDRLSAFGTTPIGILPFPSILVGGQNDPYMSSARARRTASFWGSEFVDVGMVGHINCEAGVDDWAFGKALLNRLTTQSRDQSNTKRGAEEAGLWASYWSVSGAYPI